MKFAVAQFHTGRTFKKSLTHANVCAIPTLSYDTLIRIFEQSWVPKLTRLKEIAEKTGVSISTVSRALNQKKGVGDKLREKICRMAKKTGYHPDLTAKALVKNRRHVIGVVIPRESEFVFSNPIYASVIRGICSACTMHNYYILLSIGEDQQYSSLFLQKLVDGIVVVGNRIDDRKILDLMSRSIPFVVIPGYPNNMGPDVVSVDTENFQSVYSAVSYLIQLGHKRIAFITGHPKSKYSIERLRGYNAALKDSGIKFNPALALGSDFSKTDGIVLMNRLLDMSKPPTAVLFINAAITLGALQVIHSRKLKVPADISVVSITGSDISDMFYPALTFIRTPNVEIGEKAGELLIRTIEGKDVENRKVVLPAEFVIRNSTAPCRK